MPGSGFPYWSGLEIDGAAWDYCWIGPHLLPGTVKIKCKKGRDIDVQKSPEVDGATQKNKGITPAEVEIDLHLWDNEQAFVDWCRILVDIDPHRPGSFQQPFTIGNPEPNHMGITVITVTDVESESPNCKSGKNYKIKAQQWFAKPKATKSKTVAAKKGQEIAPVGPKNWVTVEATVPDWVTNALPPVTP